MKQTMWIRACLLGLAGLLAGCAAAPTRYYTLAAPAMLQPAEAVSGFSGAALRLTVPWIPPEAERPQLVVRDPSRDPAVQVLNESLWSAPLDQQIREVLAAEVGRRLGMPDAQLLPDGNAAKVRRIDVRIDRFDMVWGQFVALDAGWTDRAPGADRARLCRASVRVPVTGDVAALVEAQRQALRRLGGLIVQAAAPAAGTATPPDLQAQGTLSESGCT